MLVKTKYGHYNTFLLFFLNHHFACHEATRNVPRMEASIIGFQHHLHAYFGGRWGGERRCGQIAPQGSAERLRCVDAVLCKGKRCVKTGVRKSRNT